MKVNHSFRRTYHLHLQDHKVCQARKLAACIMLLSCLAYSLTVKMVAICSSEMSADFSSGYAALYLKRKNSSILYFVISMYRNIVQTEVKAFGAFKSLKSHDTLFKNETYTALLFLECLRDMFLLHTYSMYCSGSRHQ